MERDERLCNSTTISSMAVMLLQLEKEVPELSEGHHIELNGFKIQKIDGGDD